MGSNQDFAAIGAGIPTSRWCFLPVYVWEQEMLHPSFWVFALQSRIAWSKYKLSTKYVNFRYTGRKLIRIKIWSKFQISNLPFLFLSGGVLGGVCIPIEWGWCVYCSAPVFPLTWTPARWRWSGDIGRTECGGADTTVPPSTVVFAAAVYLMYWACASTTCRMWGFCIRLGCKLCAFSGEPRNIK